MEATAQPFAAAETDPNAQIDNAANAFKAFDNPASVQPRDDRGRFANDAEPEDEQEPTEAEDELDEAQEAEDGEYDAEDDEAEEAAEEAQPMPPSWGADDAELWEALPPEAQAKIAEREGERDRGLNLKLQETANARKSFETKATEVSTRLEELNNVIETVTALYKAPEPDARAFGYGTPQFNEAAFRAAHQQWQQNEQVIAQLEQQRETASKEMEQTQTAQYAEWLDEHNREFAPQFMELAPELKDNAKATEIFNSVFEYAKANGVDPSLFEGDNLKNIPLGHVLAYWKAQQFDKLRSSKGAKPKPKPAGPAVKPGVSSPRSAQKASRQKRNFARLDREGSIDAGAAVFKDLMR